MVFYSGACVIRVRWDDKARNFACRVTYRENRRTRWERVETRRVHVGRAPADKHLAEDSVQLQRDIAHAALSFISHDHGEIPADSTRSGSGWLVKRTRPCRRAHR